MDIPKTLFHYCNLETFLSILKNKTIRLTDIQKSNDRLETKALLNSVKKASMSMLEKSISGNLMYGVDNKTAIRHLVETEMNRIVNNEDVLLYIACFSEIGDLLSQWRGYADSGRGISIGFSVEKLNCIDQSIKLGKVNYIDDDITPNEVKNYTDILCDIISTRINENNIEDLFNNKPTSMSSLFENEIFRDSILFKNISFQEEHEWRLVLDDEVSKVDDWYELYNWEDDTNKTGLEKVIPQALQFYSTGDDIISYLDVNFYIEDKDDPCEAINSIVIGPNCKLKYEDIYQLLGHFGFDPDHVEITKSKSSYRI